MPACFCATSSPPGGRSTASVREGLCIPSSTALSVSPRGRSPLFPDGFTCTLLLVDRCPFVVLNLPLTLSLREKSKHSHLPFTLLDKMVVPDFGNLKSDIGVGKLNEYLASRSFITGYSATQDDAIIFSKLLGAPNATKFVDASRWYRHVSHFSPVQKAAWPKGELSAEKPKKEEDDDDIDLFGEDDADKEAVKKLAESKKKEAAGKKKKEVINKSSLVIEVKPADAETSLDEISKLCKEIKIEGVTWGEAVKKVPVAFGLYKLQLCCTILDDIVNTNEIVDQIEALGMTQEQLEKLAKRQEGDDEEEDEDEETYGLVQSAEIVSFNKL
ncbi:EF-1 guanine nucleotide exchange domain-containing protein [Toxoplasma gondii ARI]|uniref:EF-1 guanine nucleotide exchange domain-containing protein n=1 Tax=Toxoplasma gondii ARI TaxID=1074872 RepID=A0A139XX43_TOXGO|nr:EF-1 guanine nucleotide exchange domain-containing protein [Toxoplasma gondii ARI]